MKTQQFQIRTNAPNFGESYGVWCAESNIYGYYNEDHGESFTDEKGRLWKFDKDHHKPRYKRQGGNFEKQTTATHGTFAATLAEARELCGDLQKRTRNGWWVRLYEC